MLFLLFFFMTSSIYRPNDPRREIWIKNSGNELLQDIDGVKRKIFCEDHFDPKYFRTQFNRTILRRDAIPYPYEDSQDSHEVGQSYRHFRLLSLRFN